MARTQQRKCYIPGCYVKSLGKSHTPTFAFPKDEDRRQEWLEIVKEAFPDSTLKPLTTSWAVCLKHFVLSDFHNFPVIGFSGGFKNFVNFLLFFFIENSLSTPPQKGCRTVGFWNLKNSSRPSGEENEGQQQA